MVQINFAQKTVNVKIVYYGPGMSGKTTNLEVIHQRAPEGNRGDLTSISTDGDRTLFFDYMPLDLGTVAGMRTQFQIYTVPGQVYYNSTRKLVLQGVDGVIFVADSAENMLEQNLQSLHNLEENLNEYGKSLATMPHVIQFNKRDLPDAMSVEELSRHMNLHGAKVFEAVASSGQGVFPTLKSLAATVLKTIMQEAGESPRSAAPAPKVEAPAAPMPTASKTLDVDVPDRQNPYAEGDAPSAPSRTSAPQPAGSSATAMRQAQRKQLLAQEDRRPQTAKASASARPQAKKRTGTARAVAARRAPEPVTPAPAKKNFMTPVAVGIAAVLGAVGAWLVLNVLG